MRITRTLVSAAIVLCGLPLTHPLPASADDVEVRSDSGGYVQGEYGYDGLSSRNDRESSTPQARSGSSITAEEEDYEDIPMYWCDGERSVGSPYDCWDDSVPPLDLDQPTARQISRQLIVRLQLPRPTPQFGPDPSDNEWNMAAVGYPLWLWTEGPRTVTQTTSAHGHTFTLRARYRSTTFEMGDGNTKRCANTSAYRPRTTPGEASPTCGYTYLNAPRGGSYTVTATTHWEVDWSVAGFSGTLPGTHSASRRLAVGELQAIVVE